MERIYRYIDTCPTSAMMDIIWNEITDETEISNKGGYRVYAAIVWIIVIALLVINIFCIGYSCWNGKLKPKGLIPYNKMSATETESEDEYEIYKL